jgi:hypothetical protein
MERYFNELYFTRFDVMNLLFFINRLIAIGNKKIP